MVARFEYAPGETTLIAGPSVAVLANVDPTSDLALALAAQAESPAATIDSMLEILVAPGLRAIDSFALLSTGSEGSRVVVRGQFKGICSDNPELLGRGLWSDHTVSGQQVRIEASQPGLAWLQLTHGVVLAAACRLTGVRQPLDEIAAMTHRASDLRRIALGLVAESSSAPESSLETSVVAADEPNTSSTWTEPDSVSPPAAVAPRRSVPQGVESYDGSGEYDFDGLFDIDHTRSAIELRAAETAAEPSDPIQLSEPIPEPAPKPVFGHTLPSPITGELPPSKTPESAEPVVQARAKPTFISSFPWAAESNARSPETTPVAADTTSGSGQAPTTGQHRVVGTAAGDELAARPVDGTNAEPKQLLPGQMDQSAEIGGTPMVLAIRCPTGHLNAVHTESCRVCGLVLPQQQTPALVPRPPLGLLRLESGGTVLLDRGAILGRNPRLPKGLTGQKPNLVRLPDPERDISSVHLEVSLDGWRVTVTDLGSTNGTQLELPGSPPISLRPKDPHTIEPGTKITLAEVCSFIFEAIE